MLYYQGDHTQDDLPLRFLRATILTLFHNNVASCGALNILPLNSASSILGDPGTVSRVGRNGGESFQFVLYPIDLPWVSKDALLKTKTTTVSGKGQDTFSIRSAVFHHFDQFMSIIQMSAGLLF